MELDLDRMRPGASFYSLASEDSTKRSVPEIHPHGRRRKLTNSPMIHAGFVTRLKFNGRNMDSMDRMESRAVILDEAAILTRVFFGLAAMTLTICSKRFQRTCTGQDSRRRNASVSWTNATRNVKNLNRPPPPPPQQQRPNQQRQQSKIVELDLREEKQR